MKNSYNYVKNGLFITALLIGTNVYADACRNSIIELVEVARELGEKNMEPPSLFNSEELVANKILIKLNYLQQIDTLKQKVKYSCYVEPVKAQPKYKKKVKAPQVKK